MWLFAVFCSIAMADSKLPDVLKKIELRYSTGKTLSAKFDQLVSSSATQSQKKESGVVYFQRPNQMRWETEKPDINLLVSDGKTFWFYTPPFFSGEKGQVVIQNAKSVRSKLAERLLSGSFSTLKDVTIDLIGPRTFRLTPKAGTAGTVKSATLQLDSKDQTIEKVTLEHEGGNRAEITLSQIEVGKKLDSKLFQFKAPPQTDIIKNN